VTIAAAGTVPWRQVDGALQVALVHRPKYDDWSWSKGKLDPDEQWPVAAVRETLEETGLRVRLARPLPPTSYQVVDRDGSQATKQVRYWAAQVTGGSGELVHEIDEVAWLDPQSAHDRLDYAHDRSQLRAIVRADKDATLLTWPVVVVRHALAVPRSTWKKTDHRRPLVGAGRARSGVVTGILDAYGITELVTSPSKRCVQTIQPYAVSAGIRPVTKNAVSEEGFEHKGPEPTRRLVEKLLAQETAVALCTHGPVLPTILKVLRAAVDRDAPGGRKTHRALGQAIHANLDKGEALVAHVARPGNALRVVAVERHRL
jgi:8-oxo-dGTP diphosphatase